MGRGARTRCVVLALILTLVTSASPAAAAYSHISTQVAATQPTEPDEEFVPEEAPGMSPAAQNLMMIGVGILLTLCSILAISMLRGGRLGRWWYYGGKSLNDLDNRRPLVTLFDSYRSRRRD